MSTRSVQCPRCLRPRACALVFVVASLLSTASLAQDSQWEAPGAAPAESLTVLRLIDGSTIRGTLVEETEAFVVIENRLLGRIRVPREHIEAILGENGKEKAAAAQSFDPDYNSVLLGPTPETLPKGTGYFRSFEILILNFGAAPMNNLNLSIATLFPVSSGLGMLSAGFKYRLLSREKHHIGLAVAATGTLVNDGKLATLSGIIGVGNRRRSLSFSIHEAFVQDEDPGAFYIVCGDVQFGSSAKLLLEFGNSANRVLDDEDVNGFINLGVRMFWDRTSFTLTGFRPLFEDDTEGFIAFPVAMFARHW